MLRKFIRSPFMILFLICAIAGVWPLFAVTKGDVVLWLNGMHGPVADTFFKYWTNLGDGVVLGILLAFFLFYRYYHALVTVVSIIVQSIVISLFKRWIFEGLERPLAYFDGKADLNLVEGVQVHHFSTFPSGHTTTAFSVFALLAVAFAMKKPWLSTVFFIMAALVGVSRIYLAQHFYADVYGGAWLGVLSVLTGIAVVQFWWIRDKPENYTRSLLNKS